mmetsp:Transcript_28263/g.64011  ORF Transcript_28263/g.64011 Transcript_28263/m.64011 type:complete len:260 (+) Transcript_28263:136-915(+)
MRLEHAGAAGSRCRASHLTQRISEGAASSSASNHSFQAASAPGNVGQSRSRKPAISRPAAPSPQCAASSLTDLKARDVEGRRLRRLSAPRSRQCGPQERSCGSAAGAVVEACTVSKGGPLSRAHQADLRDLALQGIGDALCGVEVQGRLQLPYHRGTTLQGGGEHHAVRLEPGPEGANRLQRGPDLRLARVAVGLGNGEELRGAAQAEEGLHCGLGDSSARRCAQKRAIEAHGDHPPSPPVGAAATAALAGRGIAGLRL